MPGAGAIRPLSQPPWGDPVAEPIAAPPGGRPYALPGRSFIPPTPAPVGPQFDNRFAPEQGVDLLAFFGGVVERALRNWLQAEE